jgi:hypothetical protein
MKPDALKDAIYGGIAEMMRNPKFYRFSKVGSQYSAWTEEGERALHDFIKEMIPIVDQTERDDLTRRAVEATMDTLTKK